MTFDYETETGHLTAFLRGYGYDVVHDGACMYVHDVADIERLFHALRKREGQMPYVKEMDADTYEVRLNP